MNNYNGQFSDYTVLESKQIPAGAISKKFMAGVFTWMFVALGVSTLFSFLFATNASLMNILVVETTKGLRLTGTGMLASFAPLIFLITMTFGLNRMSPAVLTGLLVAFAAVMGVSLSTLAVVYTTSSLFICFASAAGMFAVMALMGYTTDKDLTSFGSLLTMGLVGIIIASMINIFLQSSALYYIISYVGIAVFLGLTAYDVQKLKRIGAGIEYQGVSAADTKKLTIMGALNLYLDFINLFIYMLRIFGDRRNN